MPEEEKNIPHDVRTIAIYQKCILVCILLNIGIGVGLKALPPELQLLVWVAYIVLAIVATTFVFLLATKVSGTAMGIVFGLLTLIPCIGLIALVTINQKATAALQSHGIRVGLLGARMSDIK